MSGITPLANGTYYISCQASSTYVTLDSPQEGANVSAWAFDGGPHQQWILTNNSTGQYYIKNALYGLYISTGSSPQLVGNNTPAPWIIQNYKNGFFIGVPSIQGQKPYVFNLDGSVDLFNNATPVFSWPFGFSAGPLDNELWFFNSTSTTKATSTSTTRTTPTCTTSATSISTTKATPSPSLSVYGVVVHSPPIGAIAGGAVAAVTVLLLCVTLAFFLGKRRGIASTLAIQNRVTNVLPQPPLTASPSVVVSPARDPSAVDVESEPALIVPRPTSHPFIDQMMSPSPEYTPLESVIVM